MDFNTKLVSLIPDLDQGELAAITDATKDFTDTQLDNFIMMYRSRRRDSQTILLTTLIGFLGVAGIQRFMVNQIGMGILFLLTGGFCAIGTIIDLVNHRSLASEYNKGQAYETAQIIRMTGGSPS